MIYVQFSDNVQSNLIWHVYKTSHLADYLSITHNFSLIFCGRKWSLIMHHIRVELRLFLWRLKLRNYLENKRPVQDYSHGLYCIYWETSFWHWSHVFQYLYNLDVNSAYYDPKTRSMRDNPFADQSNSDKAWVLFKSYNFNFLHEFAPFFSFWHWLVTFCGITGTFKT